MKLFRHSSYLLALLLMINGCTENDISIRPPQCTLVSYGMDTLTYTNNKWTGGSDPYGGKYTVTYDNANRIQLVSYQYLEIQSFFYDGNGRIIKIVTTLGAIQTDYYSYNIHGQLATHSTRPLYGSSTGADSLVYVYTYPNISTSNYVSSVYSEFKKGKPINGVAYIAYEYDDKPNPHRLPLLNNLMLYTVNNITKTTTTYATNSNVNAMSFTYTYNSKGYPLTKVTTYSWQTGSDTLNFSYSNCQ